MEIVKRVCVCGCMHASTHKTDKFESFKLREPKSVRNAVTKTFKRTSAVSPSDMNSLKINRLMLKYIFGTHSIVYTYIQIHLDPNAVPHMCGQIQQQSSFVLHVSTS